MALVKCAECGNQISSTASKCPQCGKVRTTGRRLGWAALLAIIIGFVVIYFIYKQMGF
ncbi:MAG: zinc-ribbon domain-containing protein [Verrucomicrobiia bacterium]